MRVYARRTGCYSVVGKKMPKIRVFLIRSFKQQQQKGESEQIMTKDRAHYSWETISCPNDKY